MILTDPYILAYNQQQLKNKFFQLIKDKEPVHYTNLLRISLKVAVMKPSNKYYHFWIKYSPLSACRKSICCSNKNLFLCKQPIESMQAFTRTLLISLSIQVLEIFIFGVSISINLCFCQISNTTCRNGVQDMKNYGLV